MEPALEVRVTRIDKRYHARLYLDGYLDSEWACSNRQDIGYICAQLLRWYSKMGNTLSKYAESSRRRGNYSSKLKGKVWGPAQLESIRKRKHAGVV